MIFRTSLTGLDCDQASKRTAQIFPFVSLSLLITKSSQSSLQIFSPSIAAQITYSIYNIIPHHEIIIITLTAPRKGICTATGCFSLASNSNSVFFSHPYSGQKNANSPMPVSLLDLCLLRSHQPFFKCINFTLVIATNAGIFIFFVHKIPFCIPL